MSTTKWPHITPSCSSLNTIHDANWMELKSWFFLFTTPFLKIHWHLTMDLMNISVQITQGWYAPQHGFKPITCINDLRWDWKFASKFMTLENFYTPKSSSKNQGKKKEITFKILLVFYLCQQHLIIPWLISSWLQLWLCWNFLSKWCK
jgi:hypothetical protein